MNDAFERDCLEILAEKARRGGLLSRRQFAQWAAIALGGAPLR
jgi:putative spermidine/putrescine transport system substrate-binding protein